VDLLGRVYEYFLTRFCLSRGKNGRPVLHAKLGGALPGGDVEPYKGRISTPLRSGGMRCRSEKWAWKATAAGLATFPSTAREQTPPPAGWQ